MHEIRDMARNLRKKQTESESIFWEIVRAKRFNELKFSRQYSIKVFYNGKSKLFIADFYCANYKLLIEIDGGIHEQQVKHDKEREEILKNVGYNILRIKNEEMDEIHKVKDRLIHIMNVINTPPLCEVERGLGGEL